MSTVGTPQPVILGELIASIMGTDCDGTKSQAPAWPPDVFAVAATVLKRTGSYLRLAGPVAEEDKIENAKDLDIAKKVAKRWRAELDRGESKPPREISQWWQELARHPGLDADTLLTDRDPRSPASTTVRSLLRLLVASDEACRGAGFLTLSTVDAPATSHFELQCADSLFLRWWQDYRRNPLSSLCRQVHPTRAIVLPKVHVSQSGLALNNLSRNLALCDGGADVAPAWRWIPSPHHLMNNRAGINLLLVPFPFRMFPDSLRPVQADPVDAHASYFTCEPGSLTPDERQRVLAAAELAAEQHGRLDAVVLPEMATDRSAFEQLCHELMRWSAEDRQARGGVVVVGGVGSSSGSEGFGKNTVAVSFDLAGFRVAPGRQQPKHHRWRLDRAQIDQYGLGAQLDPRKVWWEHIEMQQRAVSFWAAGWLTMSVLICEDLARQEPVAELVRAVGPNLVIALLADGPQLKARWSARYATVLAEDPGCSVLTLTSLGMTGLSGQPGNPPSRGIALWKDATSGAVEIELPRGAFGVVLSVTRESGPVTTADGRSAKASDRLRLSGVHPIMMEDVDQVIQQQTLPGGCCTYPMLQPYQATALTMALFSRIRDGNTPKADKSKWAHATSEFSQWLRNSNPKVEPPSNLWRPVNNEELEAVIRSLHDAKASPPSWLAAPVAELAKIIPQY